MTQQEIVLGQGATEKNKDTCRQTQMPEQNDSKRKHKKIERIRARASYRLFQDLYDFLKNGPDIADILRRFYEVLDGRYSFGSIKNAEYAAESLDRVLKDQDTTSGKVSGNFDLGDFFGGVKCRHGHKTRFFNIGRGHYVACDSCRTYIFVGANLTSCWRQENKDIWQKNSDSVKGYKFVE